MKKIISFVLAAIMLCGLLAACGKNTEDENTFSWFLCEGNVKYDTAYKANPGVDWLNSKEFNGSKLTLNVSIPPRSSSAEETVQTMIASGDYFDIIDYNAIKSMSLQELYKEGVIMDLTPYVEEYMPTYLEYANSHPEIADTVYMDVDGEKKILLLQTFDDEVHESSWAYSYRRDWIVKYGKHPVTGEAFTGGYDANGEWDDNVVFPNGSDVPIYLSDWEWMFDIFQIAIKDLGLEGDPNSYCISLYYGGYDLLGGLCGAFNTNFGYYIDNDGNVQYGSTGDNFKVYLEAMNSWYNKGYLDKSFYERSSEPPYGINTSNASAGKIGMWYAVLAFITDSIRDDSDPLLENAFVMCARPPINDIYGKGTNACYDAETNPFHNNFCYSYSLIMSARVVVSTNAADKNLPALFTMFDYMNTDEWAIIHDYGLNKEQQEAIQSKFYIDHGLTEAYTAALDDNGNPIVSQFGEEMLQLVDVLEKDTSLGSAASGLRLYGRNKTSLQHVERAKWEARCYEEMMNFDGSGYIQNYIIEQLAVDMNNKYQNTWSWTRDACATVIYKYITGELDVKNENDWREWTKLFDESYRNTSQTNAEVIAEVVEAFNKIA